MAIEINPTPNPKPGYKTTEFWLALLVNILAGALAYLKTIDATWAVIAVTIVSSIYSLARMGTKAAVERAKNVVPLLLMCLVTAAMLPSCADFNTPNLSVTIERDDFIFSARNTPDGGREYHYTHRKSGQQFRYIKNDGQWELQAKDPKYGWVSYTSGAKGGLDINITPPPLPDGVTIDYAK